VFSKGGFVSVPVVFAAWLCRIPTVCHESDITPGLANKLSFPFCRQLCVNFQETLKYLPARIQDKVTVTGSPLRAGLRNVDANRGRTFLQAETELPVLFIVGGSLGARAINECVWENLSWLTEQWEVVHLVGNGNLNTEASRPGYHQYEYLADPYGDVLACADMVVSRAGANAIFELLTFGKRHLLIPLTAAASRGDQIINARIMAAAGVSSVLSEDELGEDTLRAALNHQDESNLEIMSELARTDALNQISDILEAQLPA
jgi:UDP-N-acetylglucosamine--N-acetylmuramyl-(pentapeptide) pyrophosphoryl-undecaprenol N-acetylglucosamine transferase